MIQEFASLLAVMKRESNTMSSVLREAYESGKFLRVLTRKDPLSVDNVNLGAVHTHHKRGIAKQSHGHRSCEQICESFSYDLREEMATASRRR